MKTVSPYAMIAVLWTGDDDIFDRVAGLVGRILKGSNLPFEQPALFRFVINA